jgi:DNA-binding NarL/FixJ family response regulator
VKKGLVYLVHWDDAGRELRKAQLSKLGMDVASELPTGAAFMRDLETLAPGVVIIDLSRIPSQGRDLGIALRRRKGTRGIPIVFAGGDHAKVQKIKDLLPDAYYSDWESIKPCLDQAVEQASDDVFVPDSVFAAYADKPLAEKLGIKEDTRIYTVNEPERFSDLLGDLPEGAVKRPSMGKDLDLVIWFTRSEEELQENLPVIVNASKHSPVWIAWPKKKSSQSSDLNQPKVRKVCMDTGMVDYKVCSIDQTWTALLFTWRG